MTDVLQDVRKQLVDGSVWADRDTLHPHDGLERAIRGAGSRKPLFAAAVLACLTDPDVRLRTGAVAVLREVVADIGAGRLAGVLRDQEALFRGVKAAWQIEHEDLEQSAAIALASRTKAGDTAALGYLRRLAKDRPWGRFLLNSLAEIDGAWLVANARGLVPHTHVGLLGILPPGQRIALIDALAPWPPEQPTFFTQAFWKQLPAEEAARLRGRMWPGSKA